MSLYQYDPAPARKPPVDKLRVLPNGIDDSDFFDGRNKVGWAQYS